ncbi:MAG: ATP-binding protein [Eubacterium ramulus]|uniref:ATP-binding protein n=1 Tax=Eubacterium ramulus TaxID=39490 RepID=UPI0030593F0F
MIPFRQFFIYIKKQTKEIQGTGLGMAITKSLTDAMGGNIRGDSTLGKGSRFCVEIPFAVSAAEMCNAVWMRG